MRTTSWSPSPSAATDTSPWGVNLTALLTRLKNATAGRTGSPRPPWSQIQLQGAASLAGPVAQVLDDLTQDPPRVQVDLLHFELACRDLGEVEDVVDAGE